jgi:hypothetical protein
MENSLIFIGIASEAHLPEPIRESVKDETPAVNLFQADGRADGPRRAACPKINH